MASPIAERRVALARAFSSGQAALPRFDHTKLRFALGTSMAELKVPFVVTPDVQRIVVQAARQLVLMLVGRHRSLLPTDEFDQFLLDEGFANLPQIAPTLAPPAGGADVRATAELASRLHPALTGGVMSAWLGSGGGGRSLVALTIELFRKAIAEMREARGREETSTLLALIFSSMLPAAEGALRHVPLSPPHDRWFRGAAAVGLFLGLRLGLERAMRDAKLPADVAMRAEAPLSAVPLLGGRAASAIAGVGTFYGHPLSAGVPGLEEAASRWSAGPDSVQKHLTEALGKDGEAVRRIELSAAEKVLREGFAQLTLLGEHGLLAEPLTQYARDCATRPDAIAALLADEKERRELSKELARVAAQASESAAQVLNGLASAFKGYKDKDPAGSVGVPRANARAEYLQAAVAAAADLWLERALVPVRRLLEVRTGTETEGGLEAEYGAGRLYRIALGESPLLARQKSASMGHLFVDVKDFTRRTSLLGQATIADFLRREFYLPILTAAKRHYSGMAHLDDRGGITVNNLLGDALSLSGSIESLVGLTVDIRRQLVSYERELSRAVSSELVAKAVADIEQEFARKAAQGGLDPAQLQAEKEVALARARGEGLEAGVFVSFGPAPQVVTIEDEVFGRSRVAIADRINESARGTARSGGARARYDALLAAERRRRGDPRLRHPWAVFAGAPLSITFSPEAESAIRAALRAGDLGGAMRAAAEPVRSALKEAALSGDRPGDIYNAGAALSEEALLAFEQAVGDRRVFRRREVDPGRLHPDLHRRYFFPPEPIRLVIAYHPHGSPAEMFRYAGKVMFKGLEKSGGIGIWELVDEAGVGALLAQHHGAEWFRQ